MRGMSLYKALDFPCLLVVIYDERSVGDETDARRRNVGGEFGGGADGEGGGEEGGRGG